MTFHRSLENLRNVAATGSVNPELTRDLRNLLADWDRLDKLVRDPVALQAHMNDHWPSVAATLPQDLPFGGKTETQKYLCDAVKLRIQFQSPEKRQVTINVKLKQANIEFQRDIVTHKLSEFGHEMEYVGRNFCTIKGDVTS